MRIGVVAFGFPQYSETFVVRHVIGLEADVFAESIDMDGVSKLDQMPACCEIGSAIRNATNPLLRAMVYGARVVCGRPGLSQPRESARRLRQGLLDAKTEVVMVEFGHLAISILPVIRDLGLPMVVHFHGYDASVMLKRRYYRKQIVPLLGYAGGIVAVNSTQAKRLQALGCPKRKLHIVPCGADIDRFHADSDRREDGARFIAVGRLVPVKAPLLTLRAFEMCKASVPDATLTMIGGGSLARKCKSWVERRSLSDSVRFLGVQSHDSVVREMEQANIFVQHSISLHNGAAEGWGVSIAEAAAAGLPVVATRSGGIPENVVDGKTGFLVEEKDWRGMGQRMVQLATDSERRLKMGIAARKHIEVHGDSARQVRKLYAVVENVYASRV